MSGPSGAGAHIHVQAQIRSNVEWHSADRRGDGRLERGLDVGDWNAGGRVDRVEDAVESDGLGDFRSETRGVREPDRREERVVEVHPDDGHARPSRLTERCEDDWQIRCYCGHATAPEEVVRSDVDRDERDELLVRVQEAHASASCEPCGYWHGLCALRPSKGRSGV